MGSPAGGHLTPSPHAVGPADRPGPAAGSSPSPQPRRSPHARRPGLSSSARRRPSARTESCSPASPLQHRWIKCPPLHIHAITSQGGRAMGRGPRAGSSGARGRGAREEEEGGWGEQAVPGARSFGGRARREPAKPARRTGVAPWGGGKARGGGDQSWGLSVKPSPCPLWGLSRVTPRTKVLPRLCRVSAGND